MKQQHNLPKACTSYADSIANHLLDYFMDQQTIHPMPAKLTICEALRKARGPIATPPYIQDLIRQRQGWTLEALATRSGVNIGQIHHYSTGQMVQFCNLQAILGALGYDLHIVSRGDVS